MTTLEISGLCAGIATVTAALTTAIIRIIDKKNSQSNIVRTETRKEFELLFGRQEARITHLENENRRCHEDYSEAKERIGRLETACRSKGIDVDDMTGEHKPVKDERKREPEP